MGSTLAMAAKPRTSLSEAKRALVIEGQRNSLGHLEAEGLRRPTGVAAEVARVEHKSAVAGDVPVEDISAVVAAVVEVVDVAVGGDPTFALSKTSYR